jgi:hypothetical protein
MMHSEGQNPEEQAIFDLLKHQPTPWQVLALYPSPKFQARVSWPISCGKHRSLVPAEEAELDHYLHLEHLVHMAKARAFRQLSESTE